VVALIGIEEHWTFEPIDKALRALPTPLADDSLVLNEHGDAPALLADLGEARIMTMDEQGIDLQVLSLAPPGIQGVTTADAVALSRDANDAVAAVINAHPDRFRAMATLPLQDPAAAAAELHRAASLGLCGAMVHGRTGDVLLDNPRFEEVWAAAAELQQPIFIHPQIPSRALRHEVYEGLGDFADLALSTFAWGWHIEAGTTALRLMGRGVLDRHPTLRLVLGHWGELLLFWHQRADGLARVAGLDRSITEYLQQNVWITASGMLDPALLKHALTITTPDRILFSSDYPFQKPTWQDIHGFLEHLPDAATRDAFAYGNARSLYGISST
jgi:predicted TIM-barrel fold metal-dependent hydrolase